MVARVRRDLIDDSEAPALDEIWGFEEVKSFAKKFAKDGSFPPRASDKLLGGPKFAEALATLRALDRLADFGLRIPSASDPVRPPPELVVAEELPTPVPAKPATRGKASGAKASAKKAADSVKAETPKEPAVDPSILYKAAESLLASQEDDGGIADLTLGETPTTKGKMVALHFQGWAMAALCRAGFDRDPRVEAGFRFLLERRQDDGGWAWRGVRTESAARPSSHLVTGMVLRAFAASPTRRQSREARRAAELLATRFLQPDRYPDRKAPAYWELLTEPRFYTDVLDALDAVTAIGLGKENSGVRTAEAYVRGRQSPEGFWIPGAPPAKAAELARDGADKFDKADKKAADPAKDKELSVWLTLRVLFVLRRIN